MKRNNETVQCSALVTQFCRKNDVMNKNRYKLVFSKLLNMLVPVSEAASGVAARVSVECVVLLGLYLNY